jgi:hypothetical protein
MTALGGREVQGNVSQRIGIVGVPVPAEADDAERQDVGELGATLGRGHAVWREGVREFHTVRRAARSGYVREKPVASPRWDIARMQAADRGREGREADRALQPEEIFATRDYWATLGSYRAEIWFMPRAPHKSCPSLYHLIEHAEANDFAGFLGQDEFSRQKWLNKYSESQHDTPDGKIFAKLLREESKARLEPLEREAARVLTVAESRGQYALDGLALTKLKPDEFHEFKRQKDDLGRSLWVYSNHRMLFETVESVLHLRLYRRYGKHYQSF